MRRLLLFARRPRAGRVKTRLVPPLSARAALGLYRAFLHDGIGLLRRARRELGATVELCADGPWEVAHGRGLPLDGLPVTEQGPGSLGERMLRAARRCRREGAGAVVFLGADTPTLPFSRVARALERLDAGADAVAAPSIDGGYVLFGCAVPHAPLFEHVPWGTPGVWTATRERAAAVGIPLDVLDGWFDVDDRYSLTLLRRDLQRVASARRAPATCRAVKALGLDSFLGRVV